MIAKKEGSKVNNPQIARVPFLKKAAKSRTVKGKLNPAN